MAGSRLRYDNEQFLGDKQKMKNTNDMQTEKMEIKMLKAGNGDCIVICHVDQEGKRHNVVIDGGAASAFHKGIENELKKINSEDEGIELMILTHADDDHIGGLIKFFEKNMNKDINIKSVWYNSPRVMANIFCTDYDERNDLKLLQSSKDHSYKQAVSLEKMLEEKNLINKQLIYCDIKPVQVGDMQLDILSPNIDQLDKLNRQWRKETYSDKDHARIMGDHLRSIQDLLENRESRDTSIVNNSSIALLLTYKGESVLLLGDADPVTITESLRKRGYSKDNKISIKYTKLSHHGSKFNTSYDLLKIIKCSNYLISTNGSRHAHPDKETLAKIIKLKDKNEYVNFYFNYSRNIFTEDEKEEYKICCEEKHVFTV